VLAHIDAHLDEDLSVEALSRVAAFSKHHFHRQFSAALGIGVHRYVQLVRLKRASYRLAFRTGETITDIAFDAGYEGPEAFARAFRQRLGQAPSDFRRTPDWAALETACRPVSDARSRQMTEQPSDERVAIVEFPATQVAVLEHRGDPALIGDTIRRFIAWRREVGLPPRLSATFNILYDDPVETPPEAFRLDLCAATERDLPLEAAGLVIRILPGGRCARLRHIGPEEGLGRAIRYLYADWLPRSGQQLRDFPLFCQRVRFFPDVPEAEATTDIFLPLA
jgi:AraC family transcriptional regulator